MQRLVRGTHRAGAGADDTQACAAAAPGSTGLVPVGADCREVWRAGPAATVVTAA